ncbi:MAG: Maf family protein [Oscillospiraceae bacterium]|nr:Maf family protein [Oscillospiraceae bacterium]MCD8388584.1 Maf family protein [Oscillospiraceae bacterium]
MKLILASASPRRKELLEMLRVPELEICPALGEEMPQPGLAPDALALALSRCKAEEVAARRAGADDVVIGADTVVSIDGETLGKPKDEADARRMLTALSGRTHSVYTGVTVIRGARTLCHAERSDVRFRALEESEIDRYIATGEPMDKAGAYGAQGLASLFVERIEGDFFNVMGLPLCALGKLLNCVDVKLL